MSPPVRNTIIHNTLYSIIGRFWSVAVALVLVPYTISHIGMDRFGIWALLSILVGYFALLDFGIGVSYTRFIAEAYTKKDYDEVNRIANSGFVFYLLLGLPIIGIAYIGREWFFHILNIDQAAYPELVVTYYGVLAIFMLSTVLSGFTLVLQGIQKIDLVNKIAIAVTIPNVIGTIGFLSAGFKLDGLMWTSGITAACGLSISLFFARKHLPCLRFNPFLFSVATIKRLLSFGLKLQFAKFADVITFQADKTFVSFFSNIGAVGYYQIGTAIVWRIRDLPLLLLSSLLPTTTEVHALDDKKKLIDIYQRGTKYLAVVSIPLMFFLFATAQIIIRAWMGDGYDASAVVTQCLIAGYLCNVLVGVGCVAAASMNQPDFQWYSAIITAVVNIILVVLFGYYFGMYGVAIASSISLIPGSLYFLIRFHKHINVPVLAFLRTTMLYPFLSSLTIAAIVWVSNILLLKTVAFHGRIAYIALLSAEGLFYLFLFGLTIRRSAFFDDVDKELFMNNYLLSKLRRILSA